jgi:hypothetical protein
MNDVTTLLRQRHDDYVEQLNIAVAEGRDDLVEALAAQFTEEATTALREAALPALCDAG